MNVLFWKRNVTNSEKDEVNEKDTAIFNPNSVVSVSADEPVEELPPAKPQEEWIWVEGWKRTNGKMQGYGNFQFELNKRYKIENDQPIEICSNGFHFCFEKQQLNNHYYSGRVFKVKALIRKSDYNWYRNKEWHKISFDGYTVGGADPRINKMVAKEIILTEELPLSEAMEIFGRRDFVETVEDYKEFLADTGDNNFDHWYEKKFLSKLSELGMSETLVLAFASMLPPRKYYRVYLFAKGLYLTPDLSADMRMFLIMQYINTNK